MADRRLIDRQYRGTLTDLLHDSRRALEELDRIEGPAADPMPLVELAYCVGTGCTAQHHRTPTGPPPLAVPELLEVAGGRALLVGSTVVGVVPWADAWGDGR